MIYRNSIDRCNSQHFAWCPCRAQGDCLPVRFQKHLLWLCGVLSPPIAGWFSWEIHGKSHEKWMRTGVAPWLFTENSVSQRQNLPELGNTFWEAHWAHWAHVIYSSVGMVSWCFLALREFAAGTGIAEASVLLSSFWGSHHLRLSPWRIKKFWGQFGSFRFSVFGWKWKVLSSLGAAIKSLLNHYSHLFPIFMAATDRLW